MLFNETKTIYSLFDYTGKWSEPYRENGYNVIQIDIKYGTDIRLLEIPKNHVYGILAAPDCTHFAGSGAQYWNEKDKDGRTLQALELIGAMSRFILVTNPIFWVVENPVGRLNKWFGKPKYYFHPHYFGDPYTKKTALWGKFNIPKVTLENFTEPIDGSKKHLKYGGKSERTKILRSVTPSGFAWAFYYANN